MSRVLAWLLLLVAGAKGCASGCLVTLDVGDARATAVQSCCTCLEQSNTANASWDPDAGVSVDGGGDDNHACLRDGTAATCSVALLDDRQVALLGACVVQDGPCAEACNNLLLFP